MQNVSWGALAVSGCMIVYFVFLGIASYSPSMIPENSYGFYQAIVGNLSEKYQYVENKLTIGEDPWDKCVLPKYDVWDEEVMPYVNPNKNPLKNCDTSFVPFTALQNSSWKIVNTNKNLECRARCHTRKSDRRNHIGEWMRTPGPVDCEFLEAACSENNQDVYGYLHSQVIPKPPIEKPTIDISSLMQFDVFVILLDSLSYSQGRRALPRTLSYFTNHMDGVIFPYVNKVGENSRPNGIPIWFGKSLEKIDKTLLDEKVIPPDWPHKYFCKTYKDNETSLFSEFHDYGYRTLLAEDWADGTMNWPNCVGFENPPIDHFMRPFQNAYERKNHGTSLTQKHLNGKLCRETHHTLLDYMGQFTKAYPDQRKFGWVWAIDLGHNTENGFAHADKDFHNYLIKHRKALDESFVFILGDHGLRFGDVRKTFVGSLDVNNPFTALSIPKVLRKTTKILEIMTENAKQIQSHYDTRATILDIMKYQSANSFSETMPREIPGEKGSSYIRKQPSTPRNCRNMPVPLQYCICQFKKSKLPRNTTTAESIGKALATAVNTQIAEANFTKMCIKMEWEKTTSLLAYDDKFKGATLYSVTAVMKEPSNAEFKGNVKIMNGEIKVLGMVERSNKYGKTADCMKSEHHRPYCYCADQNSDGKKKTKTSG
ncbi:Sulfatase domain-containing protein [Caenorhabditis elegans]